MRRQKEFYVYVYLNPLAPGYYTCDDMAFKFKPIYVGKGCGNRLFYHLNEAKKDYEVVNSEKVDLIRKILDSGKNPVVYKIKENLTNNEAMCIEKKLIDTFGITREDGILTNISKGGVVHKHQNETIDFIRLILEDAKERLQQSLNQFHNILDKLPRGSIQYKKIRNGDFAYLAFRKGEKVKFKYIGKKESSSDFDMQARLKTRAEIQDKLNVCRSRLTDVERLIFILDLHSDYGDLSESDQGAN